MVGTLDGVMISTFDSDSLGALGGPLIADPLGTYDGTVVDAFDSCRVVVTCIVFPLVCLFQ